MWECMGLAYSDLENLVSGEEVEQPSLLTIRQLQVCCMELKLHLLHLLVGVRTGIVAHSFGQTRTFGPLKVLLMKAEPKCIHYTYP